MNHPKEITNSDIVEWLEDHFFDYVIDRYDNAFNNKWFGENDEGLTPKFDTLRELYVYIIKAERKKGATS